MTLAQIILSMHRAGCSAEQMAAIAADHEEARVRRRCERAVGAALLTVTERADASPPSPDPIPDSVSASGAATAAGGTPKSVARAALLMMPGLRPAARRVGARLVERHNLATGRCDPSVALLAQDEGLSERSVRRAMQELEAHGLVRRLIHGSRTRANAYVIAWDRLQLHAAAAETGAIGANMNKADSGATRTLLSGNPDGRVRQNLRRNPVQSGEGGTRRDPRQREMLLPIDGAQKATGIEAAIRAKYRQDHDTLRIMLAGWWSLDTERAAGFSRLADFEAWLRDQGPPANRRAG